MVIKVLFRALLRGAADFARHKDALHLLGCAVRRGSLPRQSGKPVQTALAFEAWALGQLGQSSAPGAVRRIVRAHFSPNAAWKESLTPEAVVDQGFAFMRALSDHASRARALASAGAFRVKTRAPRLHFYVGSVVRLRSRPDIRGVIFGWDDEPDAVWAKYAEPPKEAQHSGPAAVLLVARGPDALDTRPPLRAVPHYRLLCSDGAQRYVAQDELLRDELLTPVAHMEVRTFFDEFQDGYHVPCADLADAYPEDVKLHKRRQYVIDLERTYGVKAMGAAVVRVEASAAGGGVVAPAAADEPQLES
jgi:hypothetical protein